MNDGPQNDEIQDAWWCIFDDPLGAVGVSGYKHCSNFHHVGI